MIAAFFSLLVALRFLAVSPEAGGEQMVRALFRAEAVKWVWVVLLFGGAAKWFSGYFLPLIAGFVVSLVVHWLALLWFPRGVPRH